MDAGERGDTTLRSAREYAGLRPGPALGLGWHDVRQRTLLVERSGAYGQLKSTKTGRARTSDSSPPSPRTSMAGDVEDGGPVVDEEAHEAVG